ncbi:Isoleucine--tRNA ligase [Chromobacterium violaceum]|uniref:Isoleucine--tRNA ligase n=1 Tax=Chromobacterium violaceum TaxID=536 RepID=A0A3S5DLU0_CHRVL|nr:Isoleucine--tRNA ligase [Chromobacterium violaceum]
MWFDSGATHFAVLKQRPELAWPADLYLEGSDQHRGWFQSSLKTGCATIGRAPYKQLLTHGFTVDDKGYKMSKSKGNGIAPEEICGTLARTSCACGWPAPITPATCRCRRRS